MNGRTLKSIAVAEVISHLGNKINKLNMELRDANENMAKSRAFIINNGTSDVVAVTTLKEWEEQSKLLCGQIGAYEQVLELFLEAVDA